MLKQDTFCSDKSDEYCLNQEIFTKGENSNHRVRQNSTIKFRKPYGSPKPLSTSLLLCTSAQIELRKAC